MNRKFGWQNLIIIFSLFASLCVTGATNPSSLILYRNTPGDSDVFKSAFPLGNGRLGCLLQGNPVKENIWFNEDSLWIGDESDTGAYQSFGILSIDLGQTGYTDYSRKLDISKAVSTVSYKQNGTNYNWTSFSSHPDNVIVYQITADKKGAISATIGLKDSHDGKKRAIGNDTISIYGDLSGYVFNKKKDEAKYQIALDYEARIKVKAAGGTVKVQDGKIVVTNADSLLVFLAAETDFINKRSMGWKNPKEFKGKVARIIKQASSKPFKSLIARHIKDYQSLFNRFSISLGKTDENITKLPINERLSKYKQGAIDPEFEALTLQFGRYLLISSSRPGTLPANLQGIWNISNNPPWRCDFHSDINIEMNYWFVEQANLSECFMPLSDWVNSIRDVRKEETYKVFKIRGWKMKGENGPFGGSTWQWMAGDSSWVAQNLWTHYEYSLDKDFLKTKLYPILKELSEGWVDQLKKDENGKYYVPKGYSPEHGPRSDAVSYDQEMAWDLLTNFLDASKILGINDDFTKQITEIRKNLIIPKIGKWGQLQEWAEDIDKPTDKHRHISHLIGLYPGKQFDPILTPELAKAATVSLKARGLGADGWARVFRAECWARLLDGDMAYKCLNEYLKDVLQPSLLSAPGRIFQIDANFGYSAAVLEMLGQSQSGYMRFLPALPSKWPNGYVKGMKMRSGFIANFAWKNEKPTVIVIKSLKGQVCKIYTGNFPKFRVTCNGSKVSYKKYKNGIIAFKTRPGRNYKFTFAK